MGDWECFCKGDAERCGCVVVNCAVSSVVGGECGLSWI